MQYGRELRIQSREGELYGTDTARHGEAEPGNGCGDCAAAPSQTLCSECCDHQAHTVQRGADSGHWSWNQRLRPDPLELRAELKELLRRLPTLGGSVIDTATGYQRGESETVIGDLVSELGNRDRLFFATKVNASGK